VELTQATRGLGSQPRYFAADGLHPSGEMYAEWARWIEPAVAAVLRGEAETMADTLAGNFADYRDHTGAAPDKFFKSTLFQSKRLLLGLNCLEPGQTQAVHAHAGQDKFYFVVEGEGEITVGEETRSAGPGEVVWAPAEVPHGVRNAGRQRLVLLVGMAPAPGG
jgi:mannose-6-phosphate isomerase-like protein (cupin superfamily)